MGRLLGVLLAVAAMPSFGDDRDYSRSRRNDGYYGRGRDDGYYGRDRGNGRDDGYYGRDRGGSGYGNDRALFANVQRNLRRAQSESRGLSSREHERYQNAYRRLSEFESRYAQGRWDNGKLDQAIEDVNNVVRHNPMSSRSRQVLSQDLSALRQFRANRGGGYGYGNGNGNRQPYPW